MKLTSLLQFVDNLKQAGEIDNLQQACGVFGCIFARIFDEIYERVELERRYMQSGNFCDGGKMQSQ